MRYDVQSQWWEDLDNLRDMVGYLRDYVCLDAETTLRNVEEMLEKPWHFTNDYVQMRSIGYPEES